MSEIWKKMKYKGFSHYKVSNYGKVLNTKTNRIVRGHLIPSSSRGFFVQIQLEHRGYRLCKFLHIIVADHFKDFNLRAWHQDWNGVNNKESNLIEMSYGDILRKCHNSILNNKCVFKWTSGKYSAYRTMFKVDKKLHTFGYTKTKRDAEILRDFAFSFIYNTKES